MRVAGKLTFITDCASGRNVDHERGGSGLLWVSSPAFVMLLPHETNESAFYQPAGAHLLAAYQPSQHVL